MSEFEPTKSYIYQPYGMWANLNASNPEKMFSVNAKEPATKGEIKGLTKDQAERILKIVREQ